MCTPFIYYYYYYYYYYYHHYYYRVYGDRLVSYEDLAKYNTITQVCVGVWVCVCVCV